MRGKVSRIILVFTLLMGGTMACSLFSGISERVEGVRATVEGAATAVQKGQDVIATVQSAATEVMGSSLAQTLEALATQEGPALIATAQAFATEQGPALVDTAQAFATEQGPGFIETAQAIATQEGPALMETAQAMATALAGASQSLPEDIPVVSGATEQFFATSETVSYFTPIDFQSVLAFYQQEMPANGWEIDSTKTVLTGDTAVLQYEKVDRRALLTLSASADKTVVLIIITPR